MLRNPPSKPSSQSRGPGRLLLSFGLPILLLLAFLGNQIISFDSIGWSHGFTHPLMGWDHLVTMLAVGIWAAQLRGQAIWILPLAFVGVMSLGGLAGAAGLALPSVEGIILLSCAVFSVLITRQVRFSSKVNVLIVAFFAFFHGYAHGQEISTSASLVSYTLGFMLATLLLHGAGILVAKLVVFGVTCLLTVIFSHAALAKTAESIVDNNVKIATFSQNTQPSEAAFLVITTDQLDSERDHFSILKTKLRSGYSPGHGSGGGNSLIAYCKFVEHQADNVKATLKNYTEDRKADGSSYVKQAAFQALDSWQDQCSFYPVYLIHCGLDFKHYYPDINHTPGKQLLSNGVGLTSPPCSPVSVLAPQIVPNLRNTPISSAEESALQLIFAKHNIGNANNQTIPPPIGTTAPFVMVSLPWHAESPRFSRHKWSLYIAAIGAHRHLTGIAVGVICRFRLPASPKNVSFVMWTNKPTLTYTLHT